MTALEIQDALNVYSMITFWDGRKEPGILINRFNIQRSRVEYFFVPQEHMQAYKNAFDRFDRDACMELIEPVVPEDLVSIRPVSLSDYKMILQLIGERNRMVQERQNGK
jgi:hypothetical protein